jgi:hypothetical protein
MTVVEKLAVANSQMLLLRFGLVGSIGIHWSRCILCLFHGIGRFNRAMLGTALGR